MLCEYLNSLLFPIFQQIFLFFKLHFFLDHYVNPKAMFAFKSVCCHFPCWFLKVARMTQEAWFIPSSLTEVFMDQTEEEAAGV